VPGSIHGGHSPIIHFTVAFIAELIMPRFLSLLGVAMLAVALPLSVAQAQAPKRGGTLKLHYSELDTTDPHRHTGTIGVQQVYVETLTSIAKDGSVEPFLAERFDVSPDGKTYRFLIRKGVRFHNGREMTANDVLQNITRVRDKVGRGWLTSAMKFVSTIEVDGQFVVVTLKEPYSPFLALLSELWILAPESPGWNETITRPIGTGPFVFTTWQPQVRLEARAFKDYWRQRMPYLDAVVFDLRDNADGSLAVRAGDVDIADIPGETLDTVAADPKIGIQYLTDSQWCFWSFNNKSPVAPFDKTAAREALTYSLDKAPYMAVVGGKTVVTNQMAAPGNFYFDQALHEADKHAKPDLAKGRALFKELGVDPAKRTIRIVSWQYPYGQAAAEMVRKLGFQVEHIALDDLGAQRRLTQYDWDLAPFCSGPRADIFLRYVRFVTDGPTTQLWGSPQDSELDALIGKAAAVVDPATRRAGYRAAWQHIMDRYYTVVVGHQFRPVAVRREVKGYTTGFTTSPNRADGGLAFTWLDR